MGQSPDPILDRYLPNAPHKEDEVVKLLSPTVERPLAHLLHQRQSADGEGAGQLRQLRPAQTAFPFGYIKRARGSHHESIEIQLDKYGRARFVLNCGIVPPQGVDLPWGHLDQDKASASDLPEAYRLHSCKGCMRWFSPPWFAWPHDLESRVKKAVAQAASLCSEVEVWFATRRVGPHMRRFAYPIKTT